MIAHFQLAKYLTYTSQYLIYCMCFTHRTVPRWLLVQRGSILTQPTRRTLWPFVSTWSILSTRWPPRTFLSNTDSWFHLSKQNALTFCVPVFLHKSLFRVAYLKFWIKRSAVRVRRNSSPEEAQGSLTNILERPINSACYKKKILQTRNRTANWSRD